MKIVLFSLGFAGGGAEQVFINLANYWQGQGHEIEYWVLKDGGPMRSRLQSGIPVIVLRAGTRGIQRFLLARQLRKLIYERRPDIIFSTLTYANCLLGSALRRLATRPFSVFREANVLSNLKKLPRHQYWSLLFWMRRTYGRASAIVGNADQTVAELRTQVLKERDSPPVIYVPNPVLPETHGELELPVHRPGNGMHRIVACGRLIHQKGFDILLRAVAMLPSDLNWELVILGDGPERNKLVSLGRELGIEEKVIMPGFVNDVRAWFRGADAFALSSRWEGFPNALVEALACGTPSVAADCPGACRTILEGVSGTSLVPIEDPSLMAAAIQRILLGKWDRDAIRRSINEKYGIQAIAAIYLGLPWAMKPSKSTV